MEYYQRIRKIRRLHNETQQELANMLQMKQAQYQRYESGKQALPIEHLIKICQHYNVSADYILGLKEEL